MPDPVLHDILDQAIDAVLAGAPAEARPELGPLVRIAAVLRAMPAEGFQSRLRNQLQRRANMTTLAAVPVREGLRTVTPCVMVPDQAGFIEFLRRAFDAEELRRKPVPSGAGAEIRIGDSILIVGSSPPGQERIGAFHLYVPDCDQVYRNAIDAGATSMGEPADRHYGERSGFVKDLAGNHWYIATRFPSAVASEDLGTLLPFLHPPRARALIDFLKRVFAAEEMAVFEDSGRVVHGAVRIGDAVLEMGEPQDPQNLPGRFLVYVEDCDAACQRALAAGATSIAAPADRPDGHRTAEITDPFGYHWVAASRRSPALDAM